MKRLMIVVLVVLTVFSTMIAQEVVKLGAVMPMTGGIAAFGRMTYNGIEIANGLFPEVLGAKVQVVLLDIKSESVETANAVRRAVEQENVLGILGSVASSHTIAGGAVAEELRTPMISSSSTNPLVTQGRTFINRVCFIDPFQGKAAAVLAEELGAQSVAIFVDVEQDYAVGLAKFFDETFLMNPDNSVIYQYYRSGDQDFTAQVLDAINKDVDAFFIPGYYQEIALIAIQARQNGFYGDFITGDGSDADETIQIGGDAVEGLFFTTHYHPDSPAVTENAVKFLTEYEKRFPGRKPAALDALGYDAYLVMLDAIERAGSFDQEAVAKAIRETKNFPGATGIISIDENGDAVKSVTIVTIQDGAFQYARTMDF